MKLPQIAKGEVRYEIFKDSAGEFRFRCRSANGNILASSEGYKRKVSAIKTASRLAEASSTCFDLVNETELW